jgi:hypothetical protein
MIEIVSRKSSVISAPYPENSKVKVMLRKPDENENKNFFDRTFKSNKKWKFFNIFFLLLERRLYSSQEQE